MSIPAQAYFPNVTKMSQMKNAAPRGRTKPLAGQSMFIRTGSCGGRAESGVYAPILYLRDKKAGIGAGGRIDSGEQPFPARENGVTEVTPCLLKNARLSPVLIFDFTAAVLMVRGQQSGSG